LKQGANLAEAIVEAGGPEWAGRIRFRGPWLARCIKKKEQPPRDKGQSPSCNFEVLVPAPAVLHQVKGRAGPDDRELIRLRPIAGEELPGWQQTAGPQQQGLRPLWHHCPEPTEPVKGYLTANGLRKFLRGEKVSAKDSDKDQDKDVVEEHHLFGHDQRTGIAVHPDRLSAEETKIYSISLLALKRDVFFYAEATVPDAEADTAISALKALDTIAFGGEGRRVHITVVECKDRFEWPEATPASANQKPLVLLTTPGIFAGRWKPQALDGRLIAAAVPGAMPVSGWDLARGGPKPTRFAVPAGAVYYLDSNHQPVPLPDCLADDPRDQVQGWGS
ncbi:MAG: hypothetical protein NUV77_15875, partial [Thermoguttaceae bacterium]|nr:hypothetical protein [Thermoguttaceae bacterium]